LGVTADYKEDLYNKYRKKLLATTYENEKKLEEMEKTLKQKLKKYKEMYTK
jgi:stress response protein YsnF